MDTRCKALNTWLCLFKNGINNDLRYIMLKTKAIATIKEKLFIILQSEKTCESFSVFLYRDYWPFL
jgi:hypothetical protein